MTTREPGARLVLTMGDTRSPRSTARLASNPAATITEGLEVLVQLVMAAITTQPFSSLAAGLAATAVAVRPLIGPPSSRRRETDSGLGLGPLPNAFVKLSQTFGSGARSCGRFGPLCGLDASSW